jgi:hypothetical protein
MKLLYETEVIANRNNHLAEERFTCGIVKMFGQ